MTLRERCMTCEDYDFCRRAYGEYFKYRAMGWNPDWSCDEEHPVRGCRHRKPMQNPPQSSAILRKK